MKKLVINILTVSLLMVLCGCCDNTTKQQLISKQEAEKIAKEQFIKLNYGPIEKYKLEITDNDSKWYCFFNGVDKIGHVRLGDHVRILVSKESGAFTILHGQ